MVKDEVSGDGWGPTQSQGISVQCFHSQSTVASMAWHAIKRPALEGLGMLAM